MNDTTTSSHYTSIREFCAQQRRWLQAELEGDDDDENGNIPPNHHRNKNRQQGPASQQPQQQNYVSNLQVSELSVGLYGRTVVTLTTTTQTTTTTAEPETEGSTTRSTSNNKNKNPTQQQQPLLPAHRFTTGDEVELRAKNHQPHGSSLLGVVSLVTNSLLSVALFGNSNHSTTHHKSSGVDQSAHSSKQHNTKNKKKSQPQAEETSEYNHELLRPDGPALVLLPSRSIQVHKKYLQALQQLEQAEQRLDHPVVRALFPHSDNDIQEPCVVKSSHQQHSSSPWQPLNPGLDESQQEAIQFALADNRPVCCIHGPPGTGKTTTLVELIRQAVHVQGQKVLVAAPSNVAVDNLLSRLVQAESKPPPSNKPIAATRPARHPHQQQPAARRSSPIKVVRLGHPARLQPEILPYSLEALVHAAEGTEIVHQVRQEYQSFVQVLSNPSSKGSDKRVAYREIGALRREIRQREERVVRELIQQAQVVLATCVGAASHVWSKLGSGNQEEKESATNGVFDLVVIDEAAQALEAACWIPALRGKRLILAGDHKQLPPTIRCNQPAVLQGLGRTMFERVLHLYGDDNKEDDRNDKGGVVPKGRVSRMLQVQYRMHHSISDWASQALYHGQLRPHESVAHRTLQQLVSQDKENPPRVNDDDGDDGLFHPLLLIDTAGCGMHESVNAAGSRFNELEAELVGQHVRRLVSLGVAMEQIAVITPYNGQVEVLRSNLHAELPKLEIRSVDGFQGGEREAVVLSLVRSSPRGGMDGIGFLRDDRRLNVAVTRAKRHVCVIADSETVSQSDFVKNLLEWMEEHGESRTALEFMDDTLGGRNHNEGQIASDLLAAAEELTQMMDEPATKKKEPKTLPKQSTLTVDNQKQLVERVKNFATNGKPGEELVFSTELSRSDRRTIHETAEELGLAHSSSGVDQVDRRITLKVPHKVQATPPSEQATSFESVDSVTPTVTADDPVPEAASAVDASANTALSFAALSIEEEGEDDDDDDAKGASKANETALSSTQDDTAETPSMNATLHALARQREERQHANERATPQQVRPTSKQKRKGNRLGGKPKGKPAPKNTRQTEEDLDGLDDMAFLDAQIDKVQNSHGRQIDGKGSYKTIMNGILISKPAPKQPKKDAATSSALRSKLKQAQDDRKSKKKKK